MLSSSILRPNWPSTAFGVSPSITTQPLQPPGPSAILALDGYRANGEEAMRNISCARVRGLPQSKLRPGVTWPPIAQLPRHPAAMVIMQPGCRLRCTPRGRARGSSSRANADAANDRESTCTGDRPRASTHRGRGSRWRAHCIGRGTVRSVAGEPTPPAVRAARR